MNMEFRARISFSTISAASSMKIFLGQINHTVGDLSGNTEKIIEAIALAKEKHADLIVFPELALTGYPPEDLLKLSSFIDEVERKLQLIIDHSNDIVVVVGLPRRVLEGTNKFYYNSAAIIENKKLLGFQDKILLPNYDVFNEARYFKSGASTNPWKIKGKKIGVTICEDIWSHANLTPESFYSRNPIEELKVFSLDLVLNLSASPFHIGKIENRIDVCRKTAQTLMCPVFLCNQVGANTSLIFDGNSIYMGKDGTLLHMGKGFEEDLILIDTDQLHSCEYQPNAMFDLFSALVLGVKDYFKKSKLTRASIGLSGGIDSAVVASIAVAALGNENILGVSMPSCYSSEGSIEDAEKLARNLNIKMIQLPIEEPFKAYNSLLAPFFEGYFSDITEENLQARIRGMILMAISNKKGYIPLATGNKSEMAVGYATLYGDMCGGLSVIGDVTKTKVYSLAKWINRELEIIPHNTIVKPPSAELKHDQKDSDTLPDYEILDNIIEGCVEDQLSVEQISDRFKYPLELVESIVSKIYKNEYKRRQSPPNLRVSKKNLITGRCFPIVQAWN